MFNEDNVGTQKLKIVVGDWQLTVGVDDGVLNIIIREMGADNAITSKSGL
jgi:hypothetical protein